MARFLILCAVFLFVPHHAHAFCKDDLQALKPRIERIKNANKERYALANKWWNLADQSEPDNELQCHSYYLRAQKALSQPLQEVENCAGPNAHLARCSGRATGPIGQTIEGDQDRGPVGAAPIVPPGPFTPPGAVGSTVPPLR
jgi:hypothetical protein